jgi:NAD(P)-dependent dehydrogenase (short-subunit alcohol dehydrogenase family)
MKTKTTYKTGKAAPSGQAGATPLALVTGGSSGIGYELADLLAVRGYDLILVGRSLEKLQRAAAALYQNHGSARPALRVETLSFDLSDTSQAQALFNECRRRGRTIGRASHPRLYSECRLGGRAIGDALFCRLFGV